jgi:cytochrome c oxidase subunit IV
MNARRTRSRRLWKEPALTWAGLILLFSANTASAYLPLGALNVTLNLLISATMILLLVMFLMDLRRSSTLLHLFAGAGLFWTIFMFALTFADYATRHY